MTRLPIIRNIMVRHWTAAESFWHGEMLRVEYVDAEGQLLQVYGEWQDGRFVYHSGRPSDDIAYLISIGEHGLDSGVETGEEMRRAWELAGDRELPPCDPPELVGRDDERCDANAEDHDSIGRDEHEGREQPENDYEQLGLTSSWAVPQ